MGTSIDIDDLYDPNERRKDFRRSNGAPLVSAPDDPDKTLRYSRPSSYGKNLDDENALVNWRLWKVMDGVARSEALQTQICAASDNDKEEKGRLRELALDRGKANERADMGTGLHAMTARWEDEADTDFDPPEQFLPDLRVYSDLLVTYGLSSAMVEVHMVNDELRAAGTADRIYKLSRPLVAPDSRVLEPGSLVIGDLKTGAKLDFSLPGYCVQLALYATGQLYDIELERRLATPEIDQNWAVLVHLPFGEAKAKLLWCSVQTGLYGAWMSSEIKNWQRLWKRGDTDGKLFCDAPVVPEPVLTVVETPHVASMDEMLTYCRERVKLISTHENARGYLLLKWPDGVPSPKQGGHTPEQMTVLLDLLDDVEKRFSLPFGSDPRRLGGARPGQLSNDDMFVGF